MDVEVVERGAVGRHPDRRVLAAALDVGHPDHAEEGPVDAVALHQAVALRGEQRAVGGGAGVHRIAAAAESLGDVGAGGLPELGLRLAVEAHQAHAVPRVLRDHEPAGHGLHVHLAAAAGQVAHDPLPLPEIERAAPHREAVAALHVRHQEEGLGGDRDAVDLLHALDRLVDHLRLAHGAARFEPRLHRDARGAVERDDLGRLEAGIPLLLAVELLHHLQLAFDRLGRRLELGRVGRAGLVGELLPPLGREVEVRRLHLLEPRAVGGEVRHHGAAHDPQRAVGRDGHAARREVERHGLLLGAVGAHPDEPVADAVGVGRAVGGAVGVGAAGEDGEPAVGERREAEDLSGGGIDPDRAGLAVGGRLAVLVERGPLALELLRERVVDGLRLDAHRPRGRRVAPAEPEPAQHHPDDPADDPRRAVHGRSSVCRPVPPRRRKSTVGPPRG